MKFLVHLTLNFDCRTIFFAHRILHRFQFECIAQCTRHMYGNQRRKKKQIMHQNEQFYWRERKCQFFVWKKESKNTEKFWLRMNKQSIIITTISSGISKTNERKQYFAVRSLHHSTQIINVCKIHNLREECRHFEKFYFSEVKSIMFDVWL